MLHLNGKQIGALWIAGKKAVSYPEGVSLHRRERTFDGFDRTLFLPVRLDADKIKAEYRDGILALFLPRSEGDKPQNVRPKSYKLN